MRPSPPRVLSGIATALFTQVLPEIRTPFGNQTVGLAGGLAMMAAEEFDRAAARLVEENAAVLEILHRARGATGDVALETELDGLLGLLPGTDLRVSALQAENDRLRALLIRVHVAVEGREDEDARLLDALIWDELRQSTRRRHFSGRIS